MVYGVVVGGKGIDAAPHIFDAGGHLVRLNLLRAFKDEVLDEMGNTRLRGLRPGSPPSPIPGPPHRCLLASKITGKRFSNVKTFMAHTFLNDIKIQNSIKQ